VDDAQYLRWIYVLGFANAASIGFTLRP